jgi:hypothetical protein
MAQRRASRWCRVGIGPGAVAAVAWTIVAAAWVAPARADTAATAGPATRVYGSTATFMTERQILDPNDPSSRLYQFPIYEYLTVGADNVGVPGLSLQVRGFGMIQPAHRFGEDVFTGDLLIGTLSYRAPRNLWALTAGRQLVTTVASGFVLMDGVWVKVRPGADMDLQAYGGWMPDAQFGYRKDRVAFGGRIAYDPWEKGRIGVSFAGEHDQGTISRATVALDYALRLVRGLEFAGWAAYDPRAGGFQETGNSFSYKPNRDWRVSLDYGYFNPAARLPATSIFRVFTAARHHKVGAEVAWRSPGMLGMDLFGRYFNYGGDGNGYQLGFKPTLRTKGKVVSTTGLEVGRVKSATNGYTEARIFTSVRPHRIFELTLDVDNFFYDDAVNGWEAWRRADPNGVTAYHYTGSGGYARSHVVGMTAGVDVCRGGRVQGDVAVTVNPDFTQRWSGLVKFQYAFSTYVK